MNIKIKDIYNVKVVGVFLFARDNASNSIKVIRLDGADAIKSIRMSVNSLFIQSASVRT